MVGARLAISLTQHLYMEVSLTGSATTLRCEGSDFPVGRFGSSKHHYVTQEVIYAKCC